MTFILGATPSIIPDPPDPPDPPDDPTVLYPLNSTSRIGSKNFGQTGTLAEADRAAIGSLNASLLFGFEGGNQMDTDPPAANYVARTTVSADILAANAAGTHYAFYYGNLMEHNDAAGDAQVAFLNAVVGPNGSDGWCYDDTQTRFSFFPGYIGVNISNFVQPTSGQRFPEWAADNIVQSDLVDPHVAAGVPVGQGAGSVHFNLDNFQLHANKSGCDWNYDSLSGGGENDAQDWYDLENPAHVYDSEPVSSITRSGTVATVTTTSPHPLETGDDVLIEGASPSSYNGEKTITVTGPSTFTYAVSSGLATPATGTITVTALDNSGQPRLTAATAYSGYRTNYMLGKNRIMFNNPNMVILLNTNQWSEEYAGPVSGLRNVIAEYRLNGQTDQADIQGGFSENNSNFGFPRSGVNPNGVNNGTGGSWQKMYNSIYVSTSVAQDPKIVFASAGITCLRNPTAGDAGLNIWPNDPGPGSAWNAARWFAVTAWMAGAHFAPSGRQITSTGVGSARSTPIFDWMGLGPNTATTKLFPGWAGQRLAVPPTTGEIVHGTGEIWWFRTEFGIFIVNTDNDEANPDYILNTSLLPGGPYMQYNGVHDSARHDGSYLGATLACPPIDAHILVDRSWYEGL